MTSDDKKLYELLTELKGKLQEKFYDLDNDRRPAICSDDSLRLLCKYKPKNMNDLSNIAGIGDKFISEYGSYFIETINKFCSHKKEPINSNEKKILSLLENRLVNINKRNRLLYSSKLNKGFGLDIFKMVQNPKEIEKFILSQNTGSFTLANLFLTEKTPLDSLIKLIRQNNKNEIETGNNELYIAYPFVQGRLENENFNIKAPLILFPVKIERVKDDFVLKNDSARDIIYNTTLILANNKFNGKNSILPDNSIEDFEENDYIPKMIKFYEDNNFNIIDKSYPLEKYLENKASEFPEYQNGMLEIRRYMVLGIYSSYVTSMYGDFHKMISEGDITKLIKELINGVNSTDSITGDYEENDVEKDIVKSEQEIDYINELDYSQEKVLKLINSYNALVVQGPPGTGKSQTITSIIVQAILKGKSVLMVSEKKTALDVIYSRLGTLSKFALLIDDVENKNEFYSQLNNFVDVLTHDFTTVELLENRNHRSESQIKSDIQSIDNDIAMLDAIEKKVYEINDFGTSMYNLYNVSEKNLFKNGVEYSIYEYLLNNIPTQIKKLNYEDLTNIRNEFNNINFVNDIEFYFKYFLQNGKVTLIKDNLSEFDIIKFKNDILEYKNDIENYSKSSIFQKIGLKFTMIKKVKNLNINYFNEVSSDIAKFIVNSIDLIDDIILNYNKFITTKYTFNNLSSVKKKYASLVIELKNKFELSFYDSNRYIYNFILYYHIITFEKNNTDILRYIGDFSNIRHDIEQRISDKKELTINLAYNKLFLDLYKLYDNKRLDKFNEMINRKRKMSINKFSSKFKNEMMDSIKIWLMTPEVVSDILPFEKDLFDLIIFDEASQLYVEKAIPAIYRSKKIVIAGDQKQLKPSSLGTGRILDEIDEEEENDGFLEYESLLDASYYKFRNTLLNYHYRSNYAELINFSNYAFYNGRLLVATKMADSNYKPIERIKVEEGRWIDKQNLAEAKKTVELVKKILKERKNNETIGVITFNSSQMELIEDLIEKEKNLDSEFATLMTEEENRFINGENISFFVKNIERVQGDERDIIIFSIGYGKNEEGRLSTQFGWLNNDGGENRLNVAISRAKKKIYVITSFEPDELYVDDSKNKGPKLFKEYLRYVKAIDENDDELAKSILNSLLDISKTSSQLSFDSSFEEEVYQKLIEEGYNVETQYGVGGYKIDLVIKDDKENNLLGIECDGRMYHSSKNARERDYHRQKYLESRGGKIYRIWSTNWWKNPGLEIEKIKNMLNQTN